MGEIYNEQMDRIEHPDLTLGYLRPGTRTVHHDAVEGVTEVWHYETVAEYHNVEIYVPYTQEELDRMAAERDKPTTEERIAALKTQNETLLECLLEMSEIVYA